MMHRGSTVHLTRLALCAAVSALTLSACSKEEGSSGAATTEATAPAAPATDVAAAPAAGTPAAAPAAAGAPPPDNTDTLDGMKYASYTGDAAKGKTAFVTCQTCHAVAPGQNKIGPTLHAVVGRTAGTVPGYTYSAANKNSGITWSEDKLFQYLEKPQRVVPGTKMIFPGIPDAQKRADVIAYLKTNA